MNGIKERMHLRRFFAAFISLIYFPIAKSIKKCRAREANKKACNFLTLRTSADEKSISGWTGKETEGVVRRSEASQNGGRENGKLPWNRFLSFLVCRCFHFVHAFDWKTRLGWKAENSQMFDLCEQSLMKCGDDGFFIFGRNRKMILILHQWNGEEWAVVLKGQTWPEIFH